MAWTTLSSTDLDAESPITATVMNALYDNVTATANGDSGAPKIQTSAYDTASVDQAALGANCVGQSELKTSTSTQSTAITAGNYGTITLTGGSYTMIACCGANGYRNTLLPAFHNGTYSIIVGALNNDATTRTLYAYSTYVQASPPWDLGDGEFPFFVYAKVKNVTGEILGVSASKDPFWAYRGPHNLIPTRIDRVSGRKYKMVPNFIVDNFDIHAAIVGSDRAKRDLALEYLHNKELTEIELTHEYKNQDMDLFPHPFMYEDLTDCTPVLLDPVSSVCLDLYEIHKQTDYFQREDIDSMSIPQLLENGYITLDNSPLNRVTPKGVIAVTPKWK